MKTFQIALVLALLTVFACKVDNITRTDHPNLPADAYNYMAVLNDLNDFSLPEMIPNGVGDMVELNNCCINLGVDPFIEQSATTTIQSNEIATLGRVLFYDGRLSKNNSIACASCHKQQFGFSDDVALSEGFGGQKTERNSMGIANPILNNSFFWDSRERRLNKLVSQPVLNHIEMGMENMNDLEKKLANVEFYPDLFEQAFGDRNVTEQRIGAAVSQFLAGTFKGDAKFDKAKSNNFADFTELEKIGMGVFFNPNNKCASCHTGPNFMAQDGSGGEYMQSEGTVNSGLPIMNEDYGKRNGQFKIPSLRNVSLTAPYMHDGRFETLREVLEFYNSEVSPHPNLDDKLQHNGVPIKLGLTNIELNALEAFLNTLTSTTITTDEKLSDPFRY